MRMAFRGLSTSIAEMSPLSIARLNRKSKALGPGCGAVIWTHGCSKRCPQCIAKEMNAAPPLGFHTAGSLYEWVKACDGIEGVTISGGEPFEQDLAELSAFLKLVKEDSRGLSVLCYTGRLLEELLEDASAKAALEWIDVLIDGPYIHELNDGHKWRGSSNQRIHVFNQGLQAEFANVSAEYDRTIEIALNKNLRMEITGIPPQGFLERIHDKLEANGYSVQ